MIVIKRDGNKVPFDKIKIITAIGKAVKEVYSEKDDMEIHKKISDFYEEEIKHTIKAYAHETNEISVEDIQDIVESALMKTLPTVAKTYIRYRYKHQMARDKYNEMMNLVEEKLTASNVQNQNANVDEESFGGRMGEMADLVAKNYALDYLMSEKAKQNHLQNRIYTHDLGSYAIGNHNCLTVPFDKLLAEGFNTRQTDVRPANSVNTAFQLVAVLFQLQSLQQFGGVAASHIDWTMIPYVRKSFYKHIKNGLKYMGNPEDYKVFNITLNEILEDCSVSIKNPDWSKYFTDDFIISNEIYDYAMDMTVKETYQAVEGLYHNLNTLQSRSGNQLPFTSINYGTCTEPEGRLVIKAILETSIKGVGKLHKTSVFPCGIFKLKTGINRKPGDPNYDLFQLALKSTAQRLYPNYANVDWSGNAGYNPNNPEEEFSTMGKCKCSSSKTF